jgi:hypothetical protein
MTEKNGAFGIRGANVLKNADRGGRMTPRKLRIREDLQENALRSGWSITRISLAVSYSSMRPARRD